MRVLVVAADYPKPGRLFAGIFNERCVSVLKELCERVEVLVPRPYAPPLVSSCMPRWQVYAATPPYEERNGVPIYRPAYLQTPRFAVGFCQNTGAYLCCRRTAQAMHCRAAFDAILSFDLFGAGGLAWRLGRDLGIPASGWATGGDVRHAPTTSCGRHVTRTLKELDLVFYQSHELLEKAASLLELPLHRLMPQRHMVLPRGIMPPPSLSRKDIRAQVRKELRIGPNDVLVLYLGRITKEKGMMELVDAVALARVKDRRLKCVIIGSSPAFDDTNHVRSKLDEMPDLESNIALLPACRPEKIWEYFSAADIFAFPSHKEGMPNSLLEAMVSGLPTVAFDIPPVREIERGSGCLSLVPPGDVLSFSDAILQLAADPMLRMRVGEKAMDVVKERFLVQTNMAHAVSKLLAVTGQLSSSTTERTAERYHEEAMDQYVHRSEPIPAYRPNPLK